MAKEEASLQRGTGIFEGDGTVLNLECDSVTHCLHLSKLAELYRTKGELHCV